MSALANASRTERLRIRTARRLPGADRRLPATLSRAQARHGGQGLRIGRSTVVLWDPAAVRQVVDPPPADRRLLAAVGEEVAALPPGTTLDWSAFAQLFDRLALPAALAATTFRTLAVIVALRSVRRRVLAELAGVDLSEPSAVDGLGYLGGCLEAAGRRWPPAPPAVHRLAGARDLDGEPLAAGTRVLVFASVVDREAAATALIGGLLERHTLVHVAPPALDTGSPLPRVLDLSAIRLALSAGQPEGADGAAEVDDAVTAPGLDH